MTIDEFLAELPKCGMKFTWYNGYLRPKIRTEDVEVRRSEDRITSFWFCPVCALAYYKQPGNYQNYNYTAVGEAVLGLSVEDSVLIGTLADSDPIAIAKAPELRARLLAACGLSELPEEETCDATAEEKV